MSEKRKHVTLTIQQKLEILNKLDKGEKTKQLDLVYNIGETSCLTI